MIDEKAFKQMLQYIKNSIDMNAEAIKAELATVDRPIIENGAKLPGKAKVSFINEVYIEDNTISIKPSIVIDHKSVKDAGDGEIKENRKRSFTMLLETFDGQDNLI